MLYLLPNVLNDDATSHLTLLPQSVHDVVQTLDGIIAESEKEGRRFLKRFKLKKPLQETPVWLLNEHTKKEDLKALLEPLKSGLVVGLISDAGLPAIADPGAILVALAHEHHITVHTLVGPCSIIMALQLSGFSGQHFSFHGYLPKHAEERVKAIKAKEAEAKRTGATQIFIETPYRNDVLLQEMLRTLHDTTRVCVVWDITLPTQGVISKSVAAWKTMQPLALKGKPAVFLIS